MWIVEKLVIPESDKDADIWVELCSVKNSEYNEMIHFVNDFINCMDVGDAESIRLIQKDNGVIRDVFFRQTDCPKWTRGNLNFFGETDENIR